MPKPFLNVGDTAILLMNIQGTTGYMNWGVIAFRVLTKNESEIVIGNLSTSISPDSYTQPLKLSKTVAGRTFDDILTYDKKNRLLHVVINIHPNTILVYPQEPTGYYQTDYTPLDLAGDPTNDYGFQHPPLELIVIPKTSISLVLKNSLKTETLYPYIWVDFADYTIAYVKETSFYLDLWDNLQKYPTYQIYGYKPFTYDTQKYMGVSPIPVGAKEERISQIISSWEV